MSLYDPCEQTRAEEILRRVGKLSDQADRLVTQIIDAFSKPECIPFLDTERIDLLKKLHNKAVIIRATEKAAATAIGQSVKS